MAFLNVFGVIGRAFVAAALGAIAVAAFVGGEARLALAIVALSIGITGAVFVFVGSKLGVVSAVTKVLRATGVAGTGSIVSLRSTGVRVNGALVQEIELDVDVVVHAPYRATIRQRVPLFWGQVTPGMRVGVIVDPADREHLAIDWDAEVAQRPGPQTQPERPVAPVGRYDLERLLRVGRSAKGTIISIEPIAGMVELGTVEVGPPNPGDELFLVDLEVHQAGMDPYEVRVAHPVPQALLGRVGPRTKVKVAVDRADDMVIAIDWEGAHT